MIILYAAKSNPYRSAGIHQQRQIMGRIQQDPPCFIICLQQPLGCNPFADVADDNQIRRMAVESDQGCEGFAGDNTAVFGNQIDAEGFGPCDAFNSAGRVCPFDKLFRLSFNLNSLR